MHHLDQLEAEAIHVIREVAAAPRSVAVALEDELDVGRLRLGSPLVPDPYEQVRATGAFIVVDEASNDTVGAGMVK